MAEAAKDKKPGFFSRMGRYFRDTRGEMKKVVWPSRKTTFNNTGIVLVFMAVMAVFIGIFDAILSYAIMLGA